jgi:hypothetical protein
MGKQKQCCRVKMDFGILFRLGYYLEAPGQYKRISGNRGMVNRHKIQQKHGCAFPKWYFLSKTGKITRTIMYKQNM